MLVRGALMVALLSLAATQAQGGTEISDSHFKYGTISYFRGKAENVQLGSYGEKKSPVTQANYLSVADNISAWKVAKADVEQAGPYDITWENYSKTDVEAGMLLKYFGVDVSTAVSGSYEKFKSANVKLMKFSITLNDMESILNNDADNARKYLKNEGSDGRVVHEIWVAMEAELASHFDNSTSIEVNADGDDLEITAKVGTSSSGAETIVIAPGTTFAYLMAKVEDWNSGKTKITQLEDDKWGMN